jgi:Ca2+-binding RTX toxin-like protein
LDGGSGNDLLLGGQGDDTLTGGDGLDFFMWESGDAGDAVTPAADTITDFDTAEGDALHLGDLLQGEEGGDLSQYLDFAFDGTDTTISVSEVANGDVTQTITLDNTDITSGGTLTDAQIIDNLLAGQNLITD